MAGADRPAQPTPPTAGSVSRDALLYLPGRALPAAVQILSVTVITTFFSSEDIGRYELSMRFMLFLSTLTALWLSMSVLRLHAAYDKDGNEAAFLHVLLRVRNVALAVGLGLGALVYFLGPDSIFGSYRDLLPAALFAFASYGTFEIGLSILRAKRRPLAYSVATSINALVRLPFAILLFTVFGFGISGMLWALGATYLAAYLLLVWPQTRAARDIAAPTQDAAASLIIRNDLLAYGWPILGAQLLNFFVNNLDRYMLKLLQGDIDVGLYAVASNLVEQPMVLVFQTYALAVIPSVSACWERQGREATEDLMAGITRVFLLICGPLLALLAAGAPHIFGVLARGDSAAAGSVAPWLAAASFLYGLTYLANLGLHLSKRTGILLGLTAIALAVNTLANYLLIPRFGYEGAGMARLISNTLMVLLFAVAGARYLNWRLPWFSIGRIVMASLLTAWVVLGLATQLPVNLAGLIALFAAGGLTYGLLLLMLREVKPDEIRKAFKRG